MVAKASGVVTQWGECLKVVRSSSRARKREKHGGLGDEKPSIGNSERVYM